METFYLPEEKGGKQAYTDGHTDTSHNARGRSSEDYKR